MPIDRSDPAWKSKAYNALGTGNVGMQRRKIFTTSRKILVAAGKGPDDAYEGAIDAAMRGTETSIAGIIAAEDAPAVSGAGRDGVTLPPLSLEAIADLHAAASGKTAKEKDYVRWVSQNMSKPEAMIDPAAVPCDEAVAMLIFARDDPKAFYSNVWQKVLVKADLESSVEQNDAMSDLEECERALSEIK